MSQDKDRSRKNLSIMQTPECRPLNAGEKQDVLNRHING